ncbi:MAG: glycosyltransferase family 4 protein [Anaerolineaceae bacterium]|nr:glycosyltransferase family 4 protein [Anaerolineaceae bacterium]
MSLIPVRIGLQQRVLPEYRAPLFELLADSCPQGLGVFAGPARPEESIATFTQLEHAVYFPAKNVHLLRGSLYALLQPTFRSWLEIWDPEALIVEANPRYLSTPAAIRWMHQHHHPVIGWGLGAPAARGPEANLRRRFLQSLDAVVAYSHTGAEQYAAAGITPERIFVAPNAVAPRPAHGPVKRPAQFREGQPTVLFIGRLQARKRLDELIAACAALPGTLQPRLVLVGDGPERDSLQLLARQLYPETIFTGAKHGAELEPYFAEADLFVLPGTGGLAVQQAMAHSLPVLVGEADGTQSELVRPENGWLLPDGSRNTLVQTLRQALSSAARLREMGEASYRIVDQEVNLEKMVEVFCNAVNFALRT